MRAFLFLLVLICACEVDVAPRGLRATPDGAGPRVVFDLASNVPLPNDVATRPDPTSRTGRRPNLVVGAPTELGRRILADLDAMEGWGVNQPVSVTFERSATTDVRAPAIDVDAVFARMAGDEHDPSNDPVYLVNLKTGIPVLLDVGAGDYPLTLRDPARGPNDRKGSEPNLLFETVEEGAGLPFLEYTTQRDRDFDGVLDHPNRYDWYERESDTLLLRPIVPLTEMTEYAVVLTDRLRAPDGEPVRSPFEAIHHPAQRAGVARLRDWLTDNRLAGYYGDIAGTGLGHVAFAWTFTTAPMRDDLRLLREGLHGRGVFARIGRDFPAAMTVAATNPAACTSTDPNVDRIVTGTFRSPNLLGGDGEVTNPDRRFALDFTNGDGSYASTDVPYVLVVPKARSGHAAPFPVVVWAHDDGGSADDALVYGAAYARQGIAFLAFTREGTTNCLGTTRGQSAPWWTGHLAHDRDRLRQGAVDAMNLVRILKSGGTPDAGGDVFLAGIGSGGIVALLAGATEPDITATAPIASGGALADAALRSSRLDPTVVLGPWISAVPALEQPGSVCLPTQRSVRVGPREAACLNESELGENVTVLVTNVTTSISRCGLTDRDGRFALALPMNAGDRLDIQVYDAPDSVGSFGNCIPKIGAPIGRRVETFEAGTSDRENAPPLVAPSEGLGLRRQSPEVRRFRDLAQALLDPADPTAFATRFLLDPEAAARPVLAAATVGDTDFPIASQLAFARAAGVLPFLPPSAVERLPAYADYATPRDFYDRLGARSPQRFLVENGVAEGVARLGKTSAGPNCRTNEATCASAASDVDGCVTALFDPDWTSERGLPYDEPHPDVPLRLARIAGPHVTDAATLAASWEPRLTGVPFAPDATGWTATRPVGALWSQYVVPNGAHAWSAESTCKAWDPATYGNNLIARFFATNGSDLYYLSHPQSHGCLAKSTCDLFK